MNRVRPTLRTAPAPAPLTSLARPFLHQVQHKADIADRHHAALVLGERRTLEAVTGHAFCVGLRGAYQDDGSLYLLQVRDAAGRPSPGLWRGGQGASASSACAQATIHSSHPPAPPARAPSQQDFVPGGELQRVMQRSEPFCDEVAAFYAANVVLALEFVHGQVCVDKCGVRARCVGGATPHPLDSVSR